MAGVNGRDAILRFARSFVAWRTAHPQFLLFVVAIVTGFLAGIAATLFRGLESFVQGLFFGDGGDRLATQLTSLHWSRVLFAPVLGGLVIACATWFFLPERRPQGVAQVILAATGGRMPWWVGVRVAVVSALSLGVGASAGREGPVVHLGASLSSWFASWLTLANRRILLGCGVAAAVSASFNAPIAGVLFALEIVIGTYTLAVFAPVVVASVAGMLVTRITIGETPAFVLPEAAHIVSFWEFPAFALLGVVSACAAIAFMSAIVKAEDLFKSVPFWFRFPLAGFAVGGVALVFPQVPGVGYEATDLALTGSYSLAMMLALIVVKTLATALCLGAGFSGGVFSPAIFVGAMVGGSFGVIATWALPWLSSGIGAYAIVGMGAVAGAVLGAPVSTVLMVFELTSNYDMTIAVMVATAISSLITQQLHKPSFFLWQLERRGVVLPRDKLDR